MEPTELNAFLLARTLVQRAESFDDGTPPGAAGAVVLFDLAVETVAKAVEAKRRPASFPGDGYAFKKGELNTPPRKRELTLPRVLDHLLAAIRLEADDHQLKPSVIDAALGLHDVRNLVQHDGLIPSPDELVRSRVRSLDFMEWAAGAFYSVELAALSRASLVSSEEVRAQIQSSENIAERGDYSSAGSELAIAFELARREFRTGGPYRRSFHLGEARQAVEDILTKPRSQLDPTNFGSAPRGLQTFLERVVADLERVEDQIEALTLGAAASEYAWFQRRVPQPFQTLDQKWHHHAADPPLTRTEFTRALDFVTTTALHWQQFPSPPAVPGEAEVGDTL